MNSMPLFEQYDGKTIALKQSIRKAIREDRFFTTPTRFKNEISFCIKPEKTVFPVLLLLLALYIVNSDCYFFPLSFLFLFHFYSLGHLKINKWISFSLAYGQASEKGERDVWKKHGNHRECGKKCVHCTNVRFPLPATVGAASRALRHVIMEHIVWSMCVCMFIFIMSFIFRALSCIQMHKIEFIKVVAIHMRIRQKHTVNYALMKR